MAIPASASATVVLASAKRRVPTRKLVLAKHKRLPGRLISLRYSGEEDAWMRAVGRAVHG